MDERSEEIKQRFELPMLVAAMLMIPVIIIEQSTTVGYGDITPKTDAGRAIGILVTVVGLAFITLLTAAAAERYIEQASKDKEIDDHLREISARLAAIEQNQRK